MAKQTIAWLARDKGGDLYIFSEEPKLRDDGTFLAKSLVSSNQFKNDIKVGEKRRVTITLKDE